MGAIYSINFASQANQNPLSDNGNWTTINSALQILNGVCQGTLMGAGTGNGEAALTGPSLPVNQYAQFKLAGLIGGGADVPRIGLYLRQQSNFNFVNGNFRFFLGSNGAWSLAEGISGSVTVVVSGTTTFNVGDVFTVVCIGTAINVYQNSTLLTAYTDTVTGNTNTTVGLQFNNLNFSAQDVATVSSFAAGTGNPLYYSVPDCRNFGHFPNVSRTVQNTSIYDVQTSSNPSVPGTDSRTAGAPVDSRTGGGPQNSRTPGTFGPGE